LETTVLELDSINSTINANIYRQRRTRSSRTVISY